MVVALLGLAACRPEPSSPPEPESPAKAMSPFPSLVVEPATRVDLSPDPLPEGMVARVDGEPILALELERLIRGAQAPAEPSDPNEQRSAALLQLVERRLMEASADQLSILVSDDELTHALDDVARTNGLSTEQLEAEVVELGWTWEEYREEVTGQLLEMKVMRVYGVFDSTTAGDETIDDRRQRLLGCMRAGSEIQVDDETLTLPPNPFTLRAEIGELHFSGELGLPEEELRSAAREAAKTRLHLCDALTSAELAVQELYLERGFLEAHVKLPWPAALTPPVTIEARVEAGRPHTVGTIAFDQSAVPRGQRIDVDELRRRVIPFLTQGELARMSAMQAASQAVSDVFERAGLGAIEATVERKEGKASVRVDITYRLLGGRAAAPAAAPAQG